MPQKRKKPNNEEDAEEDENLQSPSNKQMIIKQLENCSPKVENFINNLQKTKKSILAKAINDLIKLLEFDSSS